ncbi:MAG: Lrp/AsnC ligand binding domain-containing protein [Candidatus Bathyarchaeia archaeon]|nr:Lrp/AsnC ligand binding domain-containing protein [Candidatus Bathyarchaeota archaeon]
MLVILNIFIEQKRSDKIIKELSKLPEIKDVYEVIGECDLIALASVNDSNEFKEFLKNKTLKIKGVKSAVTMIVSHIYKKDGKITYE